MTLSQSRFVLPNLFIAVNFSKCEKSLYLLCKDKKAPHSSFYKGEWFLNSSISTYLTPFESNFIDISLGNYSQVEIANSKAPLFIVSSGTILIGHEIYDPEKGTTKVAVSELWLVSCISGIQICLLSTRQILQSGLRVEGNKSSFTFCDKSGNAVLLATPNLWSNVQIVRTCILKHNICYNHYLIFNITWTCVRVCSILGSY